MRHHDLLREALLSNKGTTNKFRELCLGPQECNVIFQTFERSKESAMKKCVFVREGERERSHACGCLCV